jgi:hypothetical protein
MDYLFLSFAKSRHPNCAEISRTKAQCVFWRHVLWVLTYVFPDMKATAKSDLKRSIGVFREDSISWLCETIRKIYMNYKMARHLIQLGYGSAAHEKEELRLEFLHDLGRKTRRESASEAEP